jgi:hypothetical protein
MKIFLKLPALLLFAILLSGGVTAQNCPTINSYTLVSGPGIGVGNCTYKVDFTMTVTGSNKSVQIIVTCGGSPALNQCIVVNSSQNGVTLSSNFFSCPCASAKTLVINSYTSPGCGGASCTTTGGVLPVNISAFYLKKSSNGPCLFWKGEEQSAVQDYFIEYSTNGIDFTEAGKVASNNSLVLSEYTYCDPVKKQSGFYRLRVVEFNGKAKYSSILKFNSGPASLETYPNPVHDKLYIGMPASGLGTNVEYIVFTKDGRTIASGKLTNNFITTSILPSGLYYLKLIADSQVLLGKTFIKE